MISQIKLKLENHLISILFILYIFSYVIGPAIINIYLTLISLISFFYLFINKNIIKSLRCLDDLLIIIFFIFILLTSYLNKNLDLEVLSFFRFIIIYLAISFIQIKFIKNKLTNFKLLYFFILVISVDAIIQYFFGYNLLGYQKYDHIRLTGIFDDEPIIGSFLMKLSIPVMWFFFLQNKFSFKILILISVSIMAVTLSGERMPMLQLIFSLFLISLTLIAFKNKKIIYLLILVPILILSIIFSNTAKERFKSTINNIEDLKDNLISNNIVNNENSVNEYFMNFYSAVYLWNNNKLIGGGYRYYNSFCNEKFIKGKENYCSTHPHNIYLEILSDYGLIGIVLFLSFIISLLIKFFKSRYFYENIGILLVFVVTSVPFVTSQSIFSSHYGSIYFLSVFLLKYSIVFKKNLFN